MFIMAERKGSSIKKKLAVVGLVMAMAFTAAVAGASSPSFSSWANGIIAPLIQKAASWAGYNVTLKVDEETAAVKKKVNDEGTAAGNEVLNKTMSEVGKANKEISDQSKAVQDEVTRTIAAEKVNANTAIKAEIDAKKVVDLEQVAKDELQKLVNTYEKQIPKVPTK